MIACVAEHCCFAQEKKTLDIFVDTIPGRGKQPQVVYGVQLEAD